MFDAFWRAKDAFDAYMEVHLLPHIPTSWTPNGVTLARFWFSVGVVLVIFPGFYLIAHWVVEAMAVVLLLLAFITDWLDGFLARTRGPMTDWGKRWDERADKLLVLGAAAALWCHWYSTGQSEWRWSVLAVLWILTASRDAAMVWLRKQDLAEETVLPIAKSKTGLQMLSLLPLVLAEWWWPLVDVGVLLFGLATMLSLYSGWVYAKPARLYAGSRWSEYTGW